MKCKAHGIDISNQVGCGRCLQEAYVVSAGVPGATTVLTTASLDSSRDRKAERIAFLERRRKAVITDMQIKMEGEDWHGVQDCASDLRDTDNELDGLRFE